MKKIKPIKAWAVATEDHGLIHFDTPGGHHGMELSFFKSKKKAKEHMENPDLHRWNELKYIPVLITPLKTINK